MAYNPYDPYNQGIGALDLGSFGLQQPQENMTVAEVFNTPQSLLGLGAVEPGTFYGHNLTDQGKALEEFRNSAVNFRNAPANSANTAQSAFDFIMNTNPTMYKDIKENKDFIQDTINKGFLGTEEDYEKQKSFADPDKLEASLNLPTNDKYAMAISNYDQLFGPETMTDSFGTTYNIPGAKRPDLYTGLINAKTGEALRDPFAPIGGITDRGRGMPSPGEMEAYEMIGGTPVAIGDVLGRQQALEKADFYEPSRKKGIDSGVGSLIAQIIGNVTGLDVATKAGQIMGAKNLYDNYKSGKLGKVLGAPKRGLSAFNKKMRGVDPYTGRVNTQADYDYNRNNRRTTNRINTIDKTLARWEANPTKYADQLKNTTLYERRDNLRQQQNKSNIARAKSKGVNISSLNPNEMRNVSETGSPGGDSGGKVVCTMMNERYGFGSFRNKIWMKFHENHGPEYQKGYHTIFLPLVKIAKGEGKLNTAVRKVLEHMGRHVTADMFKIMKGKKRDTLGRIYRAIFEPTCRIIGKIKSALGRG